MFYTIRHITRFRYETPVSESLMEIRKHPRTEGYQRCLSFQMRVLPKVRTFWYRDYLGNTIYHFDVPGSHRQLVVSAESLIEVQPMPLPDSLTPNAWHELDRTTSEGDFAEMLFPSQFVRPSPELESLARELGVTARRSDPLTFLKETMSTVYQAFDYVPRATKVDSPIEVAINARKGVCQDLSHIMTALVRPLRIPCRYVSGYVYHTRNGTDRSVDGASHSWVECFLPELGWVGFDPANNLLAGERHIRTAIGRDYADVPPTRGVFKGQSKSELTVAVRVAPSEGPPETAHEFSDANQWSAQETLNTELREAEQEQELFQQQQQQQQQ